MISGGGNRRDLKPLDPNGRWRQGWYGTNRGAAASMNVRVPPGHVPYWVRHPNRDRGGAQLQRFLNEGWKVAPPECQAQKGPVDDPNYAAMGLDRYQSHGDVVLLYTTEENYAKFCAQRARLREIAAEGATREFLRQGESIQNRYGPGAEGPIYYTGPGHGRFSS